ncbi:MAG: acyl-CoA thioesterase [Actinobacteria bacterium]|nr:acyl-CoA thioesterase [Actinomycetota bacterium]
MRLALEPPTDPTAYDFSHPIRVRFAETDAMGIVHHAGYLTYFEEARVAYLRHLDHPYDKVRAEGIDFAVLEAYVHYRQPLRFDDVVDVFVSVGEVTRVTCQLGYFLQLGDTSIATGVTVHGCVNPAGRPVRLPDWLRSVADDKGWTGRR